jgi:AcrR family transcriptional regulator
VREQHKEATHRRLIDSARALFAQDGILATKTLRVARAARVSHGTVFAHFSSRDELIVSVIEEYGERVVHGIHECAGAGAGVTAVLRAHLEGLREEEALYARLVVESLSLPRRARLTLLGIQSAISYHLAAAAEAEMARGAIKKMPVHLLFNTWLGLVHHYLVNRDLFAPGGSVLAARGDELIDHFGNLLRTG